MHSSSQQCQDNVARQRWRLLGKALIQQRNRDNIASEDDCSISVRRFSAFGLMSIKQLPPSVEDCEDPDHSWLQYTFPAHQGLGRLALHVRHLKTQFSPQELMGFNNTGNVCVWPSEEILTYHCLQNRNLFSGKTVCELGGGMTCVAGLAVAGCSNISRLILTDGNQASCDNIEVIVEKNKSRLGGTEIDVRRLRWNDFSSYGDLVECVDVILCADCLFFDQYRSDLVDTIYNLLAADGVAFIFAPRRGLTLEKFCEQAKERFHLKVEENYDQKVWLLYQHAKTNKKEVFDEDIHYPLKITVTKKRSPGRLSSKETNGHL